MRLIPSSREICRQDAIGQTGHILILGPMDGDDACITFGSNILRTMHAPCHVRLLINTQQSKLRIVRADEAGNDTIYLERDPDGVCQCEANYFINRLCDCFGLQREWDFHLGGIKEKIDGQNVLTFNLRNLYTVRKLRQGVNMEVSKDGHG